MAKPEWGTKRVCLSCGAKFYDLGHAPIHCPVCNAVFDVEVATRVRRARPAARAEPDTRPIGVVDPELASEDAELEPAVAEEEEEDDEVEVEPDAALVVVDEEDEEEDAHVIEDAADLVEEDDVPDVIDEDIDGDPEENP